ncbi:MAG TPA: flagellar biosynthesis protein FlgL [Xanthobacteraceae bacterium]|nr:flagellar biosynthesis protein FlgL [Xanthobacteraceae bacterium]
MALTGIAASIQSSALAQQNLQNQLDTLSRQLGTGQKAAVYSDLAPQAGLTVGLDAQLSALSGFDNTNTTLTTTLGIEEGALSQVGDIQNSMQSAASQPAAFTLDASGQTALQSNAANQLDELLSVFNTQVGDNYIFSGSALNQASVNTTAHILNGSGVQAGLTQVISERNQADLGANGLGRLVIPAVSGSTVSISEDVAGSPFGFKLAGINSTLTGATVTQPTGSPKTETVTLGSNPNDGDQIQFSLTLPDGTSQTITLQASSSATPGANQFSIGANAAATAANLQTALTTAVGNLAQTQLTAASAVAAANNFFGSYPPQRVAGPPFSTATALQNGTTANTVFWYTGEDGSTPARQTAVAQVGPTTSVAYGMRANEQAFSTVVANIAVLAATTYSPSSTNAAASYSALTNRVSTNLSLQQGAQNISDIDADIANAQSAVKNAQSVNAQTTNTLTDMLQSIEGVNTDQIGTEILTIQNSLAASLSTTARLSQLSLVNYLGPA